MNEPISLSDIDTLVADYFEAFRRMTSPIRADRLPAHDGDPLGDWLMSNLVGRGRAPEEAWDVVAALVDRAPDDDTLAYVIAGPLDDLVRKHGLQFEDRLVDRARRDRKFRFAMTSLSVLDDVPPALAARLRPPGGEWRPVVAHTKRTACGCPRCPTRR
jgi:hypothetical protein